MPRALGLRSAHWPAQSELHTITGTSSKVVPESRHSPSGKFSITPSHLCPQCTLSDPRPPPGSWAWPRPAPLTLRWPGRCPSDRTSGTRCQCLTAPPRPPKPILPAALGGNRSVPCAKPRGSPPPAPADFCKAFSHSLLPPSPTCWPSTSRRPQSAPPGKRDQLPSLPFPSPRTDTATRRLHGPRPTKGRRAPLPLPPGSQASSHSLVMSTWQLS